MNLAILGSTGLVGQKMLEVIEEFSDIKIENLYLFASSKSTDIYFYFNGKKIYVEELTENNLFSKKIDAVLIATGNQLSKKYSPMLVKRGIFVIDNSSAFRLEDNVPLIIPEINLDVINNSKLIANPNCSTIQLVMAIYPIYKNIGIKSIFCATYQSVGGAGKKAVKDYEDQIKQLSENKELIANYFNFPIVGNLIPHIDIFFDNGKYKGFTKEEVKIVEETKKILDDKEIFINNIAVRVPVKVGHSEAIFFETKNETSVEEIEGLLTNFKGLKVLNDTKNALYPMPYYLEDTNEVYVGRIKGHPESKKHFSMWCVADNLRKGAATNAIQILSYIYKKL